MLDPRAPEHEIAAAARHCAGRSRAFLHGVGKCMPADMLADHLDRIAHEGQARPVARAVGLSGRIGRMLDAQWWHRNLRRELCKENERIEHGAGRVRRKAQCYVTDHAVRTKAQRAKANRAILEGLEVINEEGHAANLAQVADGSVSNPKLRRGELMVRCRGFEEIAAMMGHEAVFLTLTCPSRFHRFNGNGQPNPKWDGSTPKDAQRYLCGVWARIRAEWKREGYAPYGFRVAEPHHDGCPHWHILLFAPTHHVGWFVARRFVADRDDCGAGLVGVAGRHALADSAGEAGALKHRFTCERIDTSKGSATGYIAKYIAKNIDGITQSGADLGLDFASGARAVEASERVRVWASVWGIRQFQQIGGPSVTVWRELRRLAKDAENPVLQLELFEGPRSAADRAMWALFWFLQGGPDVSRRALTLRPMYEAGSDRYGDETKRVRGVWGVDGEELHRQVTRMHTWTVQTAGQHLADAEQVGWNAALSGMRKLGFAAPQAWREFEEARAAGACPWTGVNNCTDGAGDDDAAAIRADLLRGQGGFTVTKGPSCEPPPLPPSLRPSP